MNVSTPPQFEILNFYTNFQISKILIFDTLKVGLKMGHFLLSKKIS